MLFRSEGILIDLLLHPSDTLCTRFVASEKNVSSVKKWIAHSAGFAKGKLFLNECAIKTLRGAKVISLLPIGVEQIEGDFEKDDIVRIVSPDGKQLGVGRISCDADEARQLMGKHGQKPFIHYDYLYLI